MEHGDPREPGEVSGSALAPGRRAEVTRMLARASGGDHGAARDLFPVVYDELRALAQRRLSAERAGHTLQATALVHEAFARLTDQVGCSFSSRAYFFAAAAEAMRRILIEHARARGAQKRGGGRVLSLTGLAEAAVEGEWGALLELDESLARLAAQEPRAAEVVKLRFFAGMTIDQVADVLGVSARAVDRTWAFARAWMVRDLKLPAEGGGSAAEGGMA